MVAQARRKAAVKRGDKVIEGLVAELDSILSSDDDEDDDADAECDDDSGGELEEVDHDGDLAQPVGEVEPSKRVDWESAAVSELQAFGLSNATASRLIEFGYDTIGRLERLRAEISQGKEKWPKGIGQAKITAIEDAVLAWLSKYRDSEILEAASAGANPAQPTAEVVPAVVAAVEPEVQAAEDAILDESARKSQSEEAARELGKPKKARRSTKEPVETVPPKNPPPHQQGSRAAEWDAKTDEERESFLVGRIASLVASPTVENYEGDFLSIFEDGKRARGNGLNFTEVTWIPGAHQDAWLSGWAVADAILSQESESSGQEYQPVTSAPAQPQFKESDLASALDSI